MLGCQRVVFANCRPWDKSAPAAKVIPPPIAYEGEGAARRAMRRVRAGGRIGTVDNSGVGEAEVIIGSGGVGAGLPPRWWTWMSGGGGGHVCVRAYAVFGRAPGVSGACRIVEGWERFAGGVGCWRAGGVGCRRLWSPFFTIDSLRGGSRGRSRGGSSEDDHWKRRTRSGYRSSADGEKKTRRRAPASSLSGREKGAETRRRALSGLAS